MVDTKTSILNYVTYYVMITVCIILERVLIPMLISIFILYIIKMEQILMATLTLKTIDLEFTKLLIEAEQISIKLA